MHMNISPDAERLCSRLLALQSPSLGHLTRICSARALARGNRSAEIIISYNYHTHTSFVTETILWRK